MNPLATDKPVDIPTARELAIAAEKLANDIERHADGCKDAQQRDVTPTPTDDQVYVPRRLSLRECALIVSALRTAAEFTCPEACDEEASDHTDDLTLRESVCSGEWANLYCDVCGEQFSGFHKLNAAGDRCCPTCWALETVAGGGLG